MLLFLASELVPAMRRAGRPAVGLAAVGVLVLVNLATFERRLVANDDNALAAVQRYADKQLPDAALVLTEESVGGYVASAATARPPRSAILSSSRRRSISAAT